MSASLRSDDNDLYIIQSVPTYREYFDAERDDTLGDKFFEMLAIKAENTATGLKKTQKMEPKTRPVRRSMLQLTTKFAHSIKTIQPEKENMGTSTKQSVVAGDLEPTSKMANIAGRALSRFEITTMAKSKKFTVNEAETAAIPVPKVQAQPRPVRRSTMQMRISMAAPNSNLQNDEIVCSTPVKTLPQVTHSARCSVVAPRGKSTKETPNNSKASKPSIGPTIIQPPMRFGNIQNVRRLAMPKPTRLSFNGTVVSPSKPVLVQPPMRFGSCSTRRSALLGTSSATTSSMVTRSQASAASNPGAGTQGILSRARRASGQQ